MLTHQNGMPLSVQVEQREGRCVSLAELKIIHEVDISDPEVAIPVLPPRYGNVAMFSEQRMSTLFPQQPHQGQYQVVTPPQTPDTANPSTCALDTSPTSPSLSTGRKDWTAGMYLDFCLTLQRSFDFEAFAEKYNIPMIKVFDRFQAIVMLPLMNPNEKGKTRIVEGGRARVREWHDAKKETRKRLRGIAEEMRKDGE
jgi:hypothetical protein